VTLPDRKADHRRDDQADQKLLHSPLRESARHD
jgi:hypothetical protein